MNGPDDAADKICTFEAIDDCLEEYYKSMGINDYKQDDGRGKFLAHCQDEEYVEDDINGELKEDPEDCGYCEFDDNFPLCKGAKDDDRCVEMLKVLRFIYKNGKAPKPNTINNNNNNDDQKSNIVRQYDKTTVLDYLNTNINPNDPIFEKTKKICKKQADTIFDTAALNDGNLMYVLTLGHFKHDYTFFMRLHDAFGRDVLTNAYIKEASHWINNLPISNRLSKERKNKLIHALSSYSLRICPKSQKQTMSLIQDSLRDVALYVALASKFVNSTIPAAQFSHNAMVPFQMDFIIAVKGCSHQLGKKNRRNDDDDGDDNDNNDDKKKDDKNDKIVAEIGDVGKKLKREGCGFDTKPINIPYFETLREDFKDGENDEKKEQDPIVELDVKRAGFDRAYTDYRTAISEDDSDKSTYPRKKKFTVLVDRRHSKKDFRDSVTIFEPPVHINMPKGAHIPEWYFASLNQILIPGNALEKPISARTHCKGELITFSFHVDAQDDIRCYWIWSGKSFRFLPNDIVDIIPRYFDMKYEDNKEFAKSEEAKRICKVIEIPNKAFKRFYDGLYGK